MIIHIGYHKTGTTFLQNKIFSDIQLFKNFSKGSPKSGVEFFIPDAACENSSIFKVSSDAVSLSELHEPSRPLVVSNEDLLGHSYSGGVWAKQIAENIKAKVPEAKIIITIRRQDKLAMSLYGHYLRGGGIASFDYFFSEKFNLQIPFFNLGFFDFYECYQYYCRNFGEKNVLILPYEQLLASPTAYFNSLYEFCEIPISEELLSKSILALENRFNVSDKRHFFLLHNLRVLNIFSSPRNLNLGFSLNLHANGVVKLLSFLVPKALADSFYNEKLSLIRERCKFLSESNTLLSEKIGIELNKFNYP